MARGFWSAAWHIGMYHVYLGFVKLVIIPDVVPNPALLGFHGARPGSLAVVS